MVWVNEPTKQHLGMGVWKKTNFELRILETLKKYHHELNFPRFVLGGYEYDMTIHFRKLHHAR